LTAYDRVRPRIDRKKQNENAAPRARQHRDNRAAHRDNRDMNASQDAFNAYIFLKMPAVALVQISRYLVKEFAI